MSRAVAKTWRLLPHEPEAVQRLAEQLVLSPIVAQLLQQRGLREVSAARRFLESPLKGLHAPELLPGAQEAAEHILTAIGDKRRLCVYGDYDVDGVSGTAILLQVLRLLGADVLTYVPHRLEEGYGLNREALRQLAEQGVGLVVTVDCGIASIVEAEEAQRLGLELIVTDHHEMKAALPAASVLVHPRLPGTSYPFGWLSGSAVAFKLAWALAQQACGGAKVSERFRELLLDAVGLAALGIVADVVPLHDENRILVRYGLQRLGEGRCPGVKALCAAAGIEEGSVLRASDIGYRLAPRLNAAGRLGCARLVVELLTTTQTERAVDLARYLEEQNGKRQAVERRMVAEAREMIEAAGYGRDPALVLARAGWHGGVLGIVAGRLAELYARPSLLIALPEEGSGASPVGVGSGRSIPGFPLNRALHACEECLESHGGHQAAAGFRIRAEQIDTFRRRLCAYAAACFPAGPPEPTLLLDAEMPLGALTYGLLRDLDRLEPYGAENRRPLFLAGGLQIVGEPRKMGNGERHLSFRVRQQGLALRAVAWGMAERRDELMSAGGACCLAFTPRINLWNDMRSIELEVADFQAGAEARLG